MKAWKMAIVMIRYLVCLKQFLCSLKLYNGEYLIIFSQWATANNSAAPHGQWFLNFEME